MTILLTFLCLACFSIGMGLWWSVCWCEGYRAERRHRHTFYSDDDWWDTLPDNWQSARQRRDHVGNAP